MGEVPSKGKSCERYDGGVRQDGLLTSSGANGSSDLDAGVVCYDTITN